MSSSRPIGSAKRCSARKAGTGRRGFIGSSSMPECLIDAAHEVLAKTRGKRRARQVEKLADGFQSGLRKRGCDIRIDPQSCERE